MLALVIINLFANLFIVHRYQQKLLSIKNENAWVYQRTKVITVDTNVSKEKGKSSVSPIWTWLFLCLSFIPVIFLIIYPEKRDIYPIGLSFIGPLCQISTIYLYYKMRNQHASALSENTEINKACARKEERINTTAATFFAFAMLLFWILFNIFLIYIENDILVALSLVILMGALLGIANWQQRKIRAVENSFFGEISEKDSSIYEQESTWKWGCYYNPNDPRIMVPKRVTSMGWTINIGRPAGKAIGIGTFALIIIILGFVFYAGLKDYQITENGSKIMIDAAMYDMTLEKDQVVSVSTIDSIPRSNRTNGYGGVNKSFGHFSVDGYGKCMLYVYSNVDKYIVLKLKGNDPGYVIINVKSKDKTDQLYQTIREWAAQ
jgi:uncharacterized membrane protein